MFKKILIANRGEIALRIIRACRELKIKTVAIYSECDNLSLHTRFADEAICIGPADSRKSYLNIPAIMSATELTNADAIHPGYGFLSESPEFASICTSSGVSFIGPDTDIIATMGNKSVAKETMRNAGVPVIPGSQDIVNLDNVVNIANDVGYPVMLKASAGGGGKGMRIVYNENEINKAFEEAKLEAELSFNNGDLYLEKYIDKPRHIEIQILADMHGNIVALGERECSIQRRHQKILEESPSVAIDEKLRQKMNLSAVEAAKACNYIGAGTIEFLLDFNGSYYFMEMNTRIQVEHPVTEMVLGVDLIKYQIMCHSNYQLPSWMHSLKPRGHAIECRINAENPSKNFMPSPGTITSFHMPGGMNIRVDTHVYAGYKVPSNYDSMIAKLIVHGLNREDAINKMIAALDEFVIEGIDTIIPYHKQILNDNNFNNGNFDTSFIEHFEYVKEYNNEST
tara:strand:- start:142 stop:1506 length:1365 start_codon:yes stop_codon:yes gene_type:complete